MRNKIIKAIISRTKRLCYKFGGGKNNIHGINMLYKLRNVVISGCHNTIEVNFQEAYGFLYEVIITNLSLKKV